MQNSTFLVGRRPQVFWDSDLRQANKRFLDGLDPGYFTYVANNNSTEQDGRDAQRAAAALRIAYVQGIESLMALICATMQAPRCPLGWMLSYRSDELRDMVGALGTANPPEINRNFQPDLVDFAGRIVDAGGVAAHKSQLLTEGFGRFWASLARELVDKNVVDEHHALKHGARASFGGFALSLGAETVPGEQAPPEAMRSLGGSEFGSRFFVTRDLDGSLHRTFGQVSLNWRPDNLGYSLVLIDWSIGNVVSFLKILNGVDPETCQFSWPTNENCFDLTQEPVAGPLVFATNNKIGPRDIVRLTKTQVLEHLGRPGAGTSWPAAL